MLEIISMILIAIGLVFFLGASIGLARFPDYYTRIHAAGKGDTLSSLMMVLGLALYNIQDFTIHGLLTSLKILLIFFFIFFTSPTTSHALMEAGWEYGMNPWTKEGKDEEPSKEVNP